MFRPVRRLLPAAALAAVTAACGSSNHPSPASNPPSSPTPTTSSSTTSTGIGALSAEAKSAATGDIPDTQVFLTWRDPAAGYTMSYPEGWTRQGSTTQVTFSDKNNIVRVVIVQGGLPTPTEVAAELTRERAANPSLTYTAPKAVQVKSGPAIKATYSTHSAPNPVTGKSVLLIVDRYELSHAGKRATVDLGTPKGVDNVDAYRLMINSFRWL